MFVHDTLTQFTCYLRVLNFLLFNKLGTLISYGSWFSEVRVVVEIRISDLWAVLPCLLVDGYQYLRGGTKIEAETCSSKTLKPSSQLHETADQRAVFKQSQCV